MNRINFDFEPLLGYLDKLKDTTDRSVLNNIKHELNKFFKDGKCLAVTCTSNDGMFFGMCTTPYINQDTVKNLLQNDSRFRFDKYYIEIDSKLLNPILDLEREELLAILLHEVGHIVNDSSLVDSIRGALDTIIAKEGHINIPETSVNSMILQYGIRDTARKLSSIFCIYERGEVLADEFVHMCGFGEELNNAFNKVCRAGYILNRSEFGKLTALSWSVSLYKNIKLKRIPAVRLLRKMKRLTSSKTEAEEMEELEKSLGLIELDESGNILIDIKNKSIFSINEGTEDKTTKYGYLAYNFSYGRISKFKNDLFDYKMRIRHISTEDDALYLMRQINMRISVMEDYANRNKLKATELDNLWKLIDQYYSLRDELATNVNYTYDYSGPIIKVCYPEIVKGRN